MVLDPGSLDTGIKVVAYFAMVIPMELLSQEGGDVLRFDRVDNCANKRFIK